jgi:tartrate-resistant acid phosphatase type 5
LFILVAQGMQAMSDKSSQLITRRDAIKKTIIFSTSLLALAGSELSAQPPTTKFAEEGLDFLALGDYGSGNASQRAVAAQMVEFTKSLKRPLTAVFAMGDNFYSKLTPERFQPHFEEMYSKEVLNCPFYAILGNHDYGPKYDSKQGPAKAQMQLDYAKNNPKSRWKMPAKWYAQEFPNSENPLVKVIFLDGNMFEGALTPQEKIKQKRFLAKELKKETKAKWRWIVAHYPLFSEGVHHDNARLIAEWGPLLNDHNISLYVAGHDHNLQHLQVDGYKNSFVVSGSGGASLYPIKTTGRGFAEKLLGFVHLHVTKDNFEVQYIAANSDRLHAFRRTPDGKVEVLKSEKA